MESHKGLLKSFPDTARLILRDSVNATMGFEQLATLTAKPGKSLHRMLSPTGNPSMDNLAGIFRTIRNPLPAHFETRNYLSLTYMICYFKHLLKGPMPLYLNKFT
jgi:hypothetical protein